VPTNKPDNPLPPPADNSSTASEGPPALLPSPGQPKDPVVSKVTQLVKFGSKNFRFFIRDGCAYATEKSTSNSQAYKIRGPAFKATLRKLMHSKNPNVLPYADDLKDACSHMAALAELAVSKEPVWLRTAKIIDGVEIDLGDSANTRVVVRAGKVEVVTKGSKTLFYHPPHMLPFGMPATKGDLGKLLPYLNLLEPDQWLLIVWIAYTLAHPKISTTNYVILTLRGNRGVGKSTLAWILAALTDPSVIGLQAFPSKLTDLAIASGNAHVLFFDNIRRFLTAMSDGLCTMSTSGYLANRMLYSDDQESVKKLHCACVLNGIHAFIVEPDLAQRCLPLTLLQLDPASRITESQMKAQFEKDQPEIFRGILDLIADIFTHLPSVNPIHNERMLDFVRWLTAAEKVLGFEVGYLQRRYSANLTGSMKAALEDDPLAINVIRFAKKHKKWSGTSTQLLAFLDNRAGPDVIATNRWPKNAISLSLFLKGLQTQLSGAGVDIKIGKQGKTRQVTVDYTGRSS
jgi:hypothetical protein